MSYLCIDFLAEVHLYGWNVWEDGAFACKSADIGKGVYHVLFLFLRNFATFKVQIKQSNDRCSCGDYIHVCAAIIIFFLEYGCAVHDLHIIILAWTSALFVHLDWVLRRPLRKYDRQGTPRLFVLNG